MVRVMVMSELVGVNTTNNNDDFMNVLKKNKRALRASTSDDLMKLLITLYPTEDVDELIAYIHRLKRSERVAVVNNLAIARELLNTRLDWYAKFIVNYVRDYLRYSIGDEGKGRQEAVDLALLRDKDYLKEELSSNKIKKMLPFFSKKD